MPQTPYSPYEDRGAELLKLIQEISSNIKELLEASKQNSSGPSSSGNSASGSGVAQGSPRGPRKVLRTTSRLSKTQGAKAGKPQATGLSRFFNARSAFQSFRFGAPVTRALEAGVLGSPGGQGVALSTAGMVFTALIGGIKLVTQTLQKFSDDTAELTKELAKVGPHAQAIETWKDIQEKMRALKQDAMLAGQLTRAAQANQYRKDSTLQLDTWWKGVKADLGGAWDQAVGTAAESFTNVIGANEEKKQLEYRRERLGQGMDMFKSPDMLKQELDEINKRLAEISANTQKEGILADWFTTVAQQQEAGLIPQQQRFPQ